MAKSNPADEKIMRHLLGLAKRRLGKTVPNPVTAACVVRSGEIIATGVHQKAGGPHAEVIALQKAQNAAKGATLYVNLEPCTHHGRTPPCTDAIINAGIRRVVYSQTDPNPLVRKSGAQSVLKAAGIQVDAGVLSQEGRRLNEVFIKNITTQLPFVTLKAAVSLDGKIALSNQVSKYITSKNAQKEVHKLRRVVDGILIGAGTLRADNASLTVRHGLTPAGGRPPKRIVVSRSGKLDPAFRLFDPPEDAIVATPAPPDPAIPKVTYITLPDQSEPQQLKFLLAQLYKKGICHLLIEGGGDVYTQFISAGLVDKVIMVVAPVIMGGPSDIPVVQFPTGFNCLNDAYHLKSVSITRCLPDVIIQGYLNDPIEK